MINWILRSKNDLLHCYIIKEKATCRKSVRLCFYILLLKFPVILCQNIIYSGVNGVLALDEMTYHVNDCAMSYELTMEFGDELQIVPGDKVMPVMYVKFIGICFVSMAVFGSKAFFRKR